MIGQSLAQCLANPLPNEIASVPAALLGGGTLNPLLIAPGVIAVWPMDEGSGNVARNSAVAATTIDNNLWHAPEVGFNHQTAKGGSATATDAYAAGNDGRTRAVRIVFSGSGSVTLSNFACSAGVAHTLSFKYKRTGGTDQSFKAYADALSSALTATSSWQTYSVTWTPATTTPTIGIYSDGTTAADILICDFKVEQGSSATPYIAPQSHIVFQGAKKPTWSSAGIVTSSADRGALAARNFDATLSAFTVYHAFKQSGAVNGNYNTIQHLDITVNKWHMGPGKTANDYNDFRILNGVSQIARGTKPSDTNWHILACQYDGAAVSYYLDGVLTRTNTQTGTVSASYLRFFSLFTGGFGATGTHGYAAWYDSAHDAQTVVECSEFIRSEIVGRGETFSAIENVVVFEGDSIFEGIAYTPLSPVPERVMADMPSNTFVANVARSGSSINSAASPGSYNTSLYARRATIDNALLYPATNHILCVGSGTNDMNSGDTATYLTNLKNYCAARRAAGWKVVVGTLLPCTYASGTFNTKRAVTNADVLNPAHIGVYWDAVADQGGDTTYAKDGDELNASYYPDTVHPNDTVCAGVKGYWSTAINSLL